MQDLSSQTRDRTQVPCSRISVLTTKPPGKSWQAPISYPILPESTSIFKSALSSLISLVLYFPVSDTHYEEYQMTLDGHHFNNNEHQTIPKVFP